MNRLSMPDTTPQCRRIQDLPDTEACVVAALETTEEQEPSPEIEAALDKLRRID